MNMKMLLGAAGMAGAIVVLGQVTAADRGKDAVTTADRAEVAQSVDVDATPTGGADVIVGVLQEYTNYSASSGYDAYSIGTTSCNKGSVNLLWQANNSNHPVIGQSMYRLKDGRIEQIGQAWLKHGFCALQLNACGFGCSPAGSGCPQALGPGCSDPYSAPRNGQQFNAGPKYEVNATTGAFPYPPANPSYSGSTARRLRVKITDVSGAGAEGARYFVEGQYVHPQDAPSQGGVANNASYREVSLNSLGNINGWGGSTQREDPAVLAWSANVPEASISEVALSGEGSFWIGSAAFDNGDGTWDYEYVVYNQNVDRSGGAFSVPLGENVNVTNIAWNGPEWHSGEVFSNSPWTWNVTDSSIDFTTETETQNSNANAIRWGTTHNFRFTADAGPQDVTGTLGLFKSGSPTSVTQIVSAPGPNPVDCPSDFDGNGETGFADLTALLNNWGCSGCIYDLDGSGSAGFSDLTIVLNNWGPCP